MLSSSIRNILVVEDDRFIGEDLKMLLSSEGYNVSIASNGEEAFKVLRSNTRPSLILLDIMMPIMDGVQFRKLQLEDPEFSSIPVVIMTADMHVKKKAISLSAQGFVQKPIDIDILLETISKFYSDN